VIRFHETSLPGVVVVEPEPITDQRGFFVRVLSAELFREAGLDHASFVQENHSRSRLRTIRGLHLRAPDGETKIVRCSSGEIFDVVVDVRPSSPTFGRWERFMLDDRRHLQVVIPPGYAHGFQALSEPADVQYRHDRFYAPAFDVAVAWNDPDLAIDWPLPEPILSERDRSAPSLRDLRPRLEGWFGADGGAGA
jgi:dTDP-4-dehydrorhamnose 3,5-epimerase